MARKRAIRMHTSVDIIHICDYCGLHTAGPFAGRTNVPIAELRRWARQFGEDPVIKTQPAHYHRRNRAIGGAHYPNGGLVPISNGACTPCEERWTRETRERYARLAGAMGKPLPEPGERRDLDAEATGTEGPKKEPTEAEARAFLMAPPGDDDDDGGSKE